VDRACRSIERRVETVTRRVVLDTAPALERAANEDVMALQELLPIPVTELRLPFGRPNDVREQNRCQHRFEVRLWSFDADELPDSAEYGGLLVDLRE
jgi:hypothetical protein